MDTSLALLLLAALAVLLAFTWRLATRAGRASRRRNRVAQAAESGAEALLEALGYRILERQVAGSWTLEVDGQPVEASCRADLMVERAGRTFIAEVKSGSLAPDARHPATRRQLLEYLFVFEPDGLLLVDMERQQVREVCFPFA